MLQSMTVEERMLSRDAYRHSLGAFDSKSQFPAARRPMSATCWSWTRRTAAGRTTRSRSGTTSPTSEIALTVTGVLNKAAAYAPREQS